MQFLTLISGLENLVHFYLKSCVIRQNGQDIYIVKDNCFASRLAVRRWSTPHLQPQNSRFSFVAFLTKKSILKSAKEEGELICNVHICVLNGNKCQINTEDSQCPNPSVYEYTINGAA